MGLGKSQEQKALDDFEEYVYDTRNIAYDEHGNLIFTRDAKGTGDKAREEEAKAIMRIEIAEAAEKDREREREKERAEKLKMIKQEEAVAEEKVEIDSDDDDDDEAAQKPMGSPVEKIGERASVTT